MYLGQTRRQSRQRLRRLGKVGKNRPGLVRLVLESVQDPAIFAGVQLDLRRQTPDRHLQKIVLGEQDFQLRRGLRLADPTNPQLPPNERAHVTLREPTVRQELKVPALATPQRSVERCTTRTPTRRRDRRLLIRPTHHVVQQEPTPHRKMNFPNPIRLHVPDPIGHIIDPFDHVLQDLVFLKFKIKKQ